MSVDCRTDGSGYSPISLVTSFHSIPHVDIHLKEASTDFVVSLDYFEVRKYIHHELMLLFV